MQFSDADLKRLYWAGLDGMRILSESAHDEAMRDPVSRLQLQDTLNLLKEAAALTRLLLAIHTHLDLGPHPD